MKTAQDWINAPDEVKGEILLKAAKEANEDQQKVVDEYDSLYAKNDEDWHKQVCEREGYFCQGCGRDFSDDYYFDVKGKNQYVCGHHLISKGSDPEKRLLISNGACTCKDCHTAAHKGLLTYKPNK